MALKFLPAEMTRDPETRERFVREARATSSLEHQSVGKIRHPAHVESCFIQYVFFFE